MMEEVITKELIDKGYFFNEYLHLIEDLLSKNLTTGNNQTDELVEMSRLNLQRLKRIYKTCKINEPLKEAVENISEPMTWLMLVEAWCGDGAQIAPIFAALADLNPVIEFKLILRDENPALMDMFLTDGKKSIPKFIGINQDLEIMATWGPRPAEAHKIYEAFRNDPSITKEAFHKELHLWYAHDKGQSVMNELLELFMNCCVSSGKEVIV